MFIIKLDAIDSTNDFLKKLASEQLLENFTTVIAKNQTNGKGQMGAKWTSEQGKNLTMSVFLKDIFTQSSNLFLLNSIVSLAVYRTLTSYEIPNLAIKWPNDIMSDQKKMGGILIENIFSANQTITSIIGIGINVNQTNFISLPKATSMALVINQTFDTEQLTSAIVEAIQSYVAQYEQNANSILGWYNQIIFRKEIPTAFQDSSGKQFMGKIKEVASNGKLILFLDDETQKEFNLKELQMLY